MGLFNTAIGGLQGAVSGLATGDWSSVLSGALSGASQDYENLQQKEAAKRANQEQIAFWNMQNEYNSPVAQMARLKEAGLNPMLVYGGGNVSGNSSSAIGTAQTYGNKTNALASMQGIQAVANLKNTQTDTNSKEANTLATYQDITNMQTANKIQQAQLQQEQQAVQMGAMDLEVAKRVQKARLKSAHYGATADALDSYNRFKDSSLDKIVKDNGGRELKYGADSALNFIRGLVGASSGLGATQASFSTARLNNARANAMMSYSPRYRTK